MRRLKRLWQQSTLNKIIIIGMIAFLLLAIGGYSGSWFFSWTGFGDYTKPPGVDERGKTLWDWMQLLIIPAVLAAGVWWLQRTERKTEQKIADERSREATLQAYLDQMTELLLEKDLRNSEQSNEVRTVARVRTLTTLDQLDGLRKATLLRFLHETQLIAKPNPIIDLQNANLSNVILTEFVLDETDLSDVNLRSAMLQLLSLRGANLSGASLSKAYLFNIRLAEANLQYADLVGATLFFVDLRLANLHGAKFMGKDPEAITFADLERRPPVAAKLIEVDLRGARYNRQTKWPKGFDPVDAGAILDEPAERN